MKRFSKNEITKGSLFVLSKESKRFFQSLNTNNNLENMVLVFIGLSSELHPGQVEYEKKKMENSDEIFEYYTFISLNTNEKWYLFAGEFNPLT